MLQKGLTMKDPHDKRWSIGMVVLTIVGSMALLGYLSIKFLPSAADRSSPANPQSGAVQSASYRTAPANWVDDTGISSDRPVKREVILHRDIDARIGKCIVTYRGLAPGSNIKIDVVILELDPDVSYSRVIDIERAKNGFQLGEENYQLISARKLRLYVWHYD